MIIEQPLKANDAVTIKTIGGDELVARYIQEDERTVTIYKPLALVATPNGLGLGPFSFTVDPDAKLKLNKSAIVFMAKTEEGMASQYMSSTSNIKAVASVPKFQL